VETENTRLLDIGPTVLDLFGVGVPDYMDGKVWKVAEETRAESPEPRARVAVPA
jgi:hypothetical protein